MFLSLLFVIHSVQASGIPFVPVRPEGEVSSPERRMMYEARERARVEGKGLLLGISAYWCHPCMEIKAFLHENPAELDRIKEKYIVLMYETGRENIPQEISDFLPVDPLFYPTYLTFHEDGRGWRYLSEAEGMTFSDRVLSSEVRAVTMDDADRINHAFASLDHIPDLNSEEEAAVILNSFLYYNPYEFTYSELKTASKTLYEFTQKWIGEHQPLTEEQKENLSNLFNAWSQNFMTHYLNTNQISIVEIDSEYPFLGMILKKTEAAVTVYFDDALRTQIETLGVKAASSNCESLANEWYAGWDLEDGKKQEPEMKLKLHTQWICKNLKALANGPDEFSLGVEVDDWSKDMKSEYREMWDDKFGDHEWSLFLRTGKKTTALNSLDQMIEKRKKRFEERRASFDATSTSASDLERLDFEISYEEEHVFESMRESLVDGVMPLAIEEL